MSMGDRVVFSGMVAASSAVAKRVLDPSKLVMRTPPVLGEAPGAGRQEAPTRSAGAFVTISHIQGLNRASNVKLATERVVLEGAESLCSSDWNIDRLVEDDDEEDVSTGVHDLPDVGRTVAQRDTEHIAFP